MASEISLLTWRFQHFPGRKSCQRRCLRKRRNHRTHNQLLTKPPIAASLLFKGRLCPSSARGGPSSFPWHGHTCTHWAPQPAVKQNQKPAPSPTLTTHTLHTSVPRPLQEDLSFRTTFCSEHMQFLLHVFLSYLSCRPAAFHNVGKHY